MPYRQTFPPLTSRFGNDPERNENILVIPKKRTYHHICNDLHLFERRCRVDPRHAHIEIVRDSGAMESAIEKVDLCCEICRINELRERENDN